MTIDTNKNQQDVKKVIAIMSGKGGVGKSTITSLLAAGLKHKGLEVGVLDADITGPSIPKMFGVSERPKSDGKVIFPVESKKNIKLMSLNLLLGNEDDPVVWRGPLIGNVIKQFWSDVQWGSLDYLLVDLPPGTSDAPLTVMQTLPLSGIVVVTSPQDLVAMVVRKAIKMANMVDIPILGLVENYSYMRCPSCGEKIQVFGESNGEQAAKDNEIKFLGSLPIDPKLAQLCDKGEVEDYNYDKINNIVNKLS